MIAEDQSGSRLSPRMGALVREALARAGWTPEDIDALLASGALEYPETKAVLDECLLEAFKAALGELDLEREDLQRPA